jgi:hypothetical protein
VRRIEGGERGRTGDESGCDLRNHARAILLIMSIIMMIVEGGTNAATHHVLLYQ